MSNGDSGAGGTGGGLERVEKLGLVEPSFVIEAEGKWFVVMSALEYDPAQAANDMQREGIQRIAEFCQSAAAAGKVVRIDRDPSLVAQASGLKTPVRPTPPTPPPGGGG